MTDLKINETVFWAGAKILALSKQNAPCVMIDLDFILWENICMFSRCDDGGVWMSFQ